VQNSYFRPVKNAAAKHLTLHRGVLWHISRGIFSSPVLESCVGLVRGRPQVCGDLSQAVSLCLQLQNPLASTALLGRPSFLFAWPVSCVCGFPGGRRALRCSAQTRTRCSSSWCHFDLSSGRQTLGPPSGARRGSFRTPLADQPTIRKSRTVMSFAT
jgi:hypothetical protein